MPRRKPTFDMNVLGQFEMDAMRAVESYRQSMQSMKSFVKEPNWDTVDGGNELFLITHHRQDREMKEAQKYMLFNAQAQAQVNRNRLQAVNLHTRQLRAKFIEVNSFIRDSEEKKDMALYEIEDQVAVQRDLKAKCREAHNKIHKLTSFRETLKDTVMLYGAYDRVIKDVCHMKNSPYKTIKDCTDRCDALMLAQQNMTAMSAAKIAELEEMRTKMLQITNAAALKVMGMKNMLTMLERQYEEQRTESIFWQHTLSKALMKVRGHDLEKERIYDSIFHLYRLLCRRRGLEPEFRRNHVTRILDFLKEDVEVLRDIVQVCNDGLTIRLPKTGARFC